MRIISTKEERERAASGDGRGLCPDGDARQGERI